MIELFFEKNAAIDDWRDDSYGLFTPTGWCLFGITYTGWQWYKDEKGWERRNTKEYWHFGLVLLNIGFGIWYHEKE